MEVEKHDRIITGPNFQIFVNDTGKNLLFQHFCNNLYLGQWELARACAKELHIGCEGPGNHVCEILKDVVRQPFNRSILSASVPSPCQLSWLCLLECEKFKHGSQSQVEDNLPDKNLVEFHLLLVDVCPYITDTHLKEVYLYYRWMHSTVNVNHPLTLSSGLLKFLQTLLSRQPSLGHLLIMSLYDSGNSQLSKNNKALQLVYVNSINTLLDSLSQEDLDKDIKLEKSEKLYEILASFDFNVGISQLPIRQMISKILEHCRLESDFISKTRIASVLMGQQDTYLLDEFCRMDYEAETNKAVSTYQACAELTEEQRWILHLSTLSDIDTRWKMFLMFALKRKRHVLEVILETGLALIKCSMFSELKTLVEPEELWPLKPLLLLLGWTHCYSSSEARQLLETLWSNKSGCEHPAITMGCTKLAYQIDLIQWCLDKAKPLLSEDTGGPQFQRAADLFKGLESHSVLYVLQTSTKLSSLDQQEVLELLQKVPLQGEKEDTDKKKTKTVRFQEENDTQSRLPTTSLDQQKDMAIFTGYCVLKNIMDAILFCAECSDKRLTHPIRSRSRHKISKRIGSEGSLDSSALSRKSSVASICDNSYSDDTSTYDEKQDKKSDVNIQKLYKEKVTDTISQTKRYLSKLQPLTFRVEILENIFSLLFLTHEDVQETLLISEYESDEGDENKSLSKSGSTGLITPLSSPMKGSFEMKVPEVMVGNSSRNELNIDYDVPFEEVESTAQKEIDMHKVEEALEGMKTKIFEKSRKLKEDSQYEGRHSSVSENISSISTNSSLNLDTIGFIANEYTVRDILAMLKDCILDVSAAKFQIYGNKADARERYRSSREVTPVRSSEIDINTEEALCRLVQSSISMDMLQKRITQLERYTSEAHWRYQLVSDENIPRSPGAVLQEVVMTTGDSSDEEVEIRGHGPVQSSRKRRVSGRKSPLNAPDVNRQLSTETKSSGGNVSRQTSNIVVARKPVGQMRSPRVVSLMLSSPVTLLTMSIRKGQFTQTKQIIKLFKLENTQEAVEVYFSQAYHKACRSIQGIMGKDSQSFGTEPSKMGLKAIASAAAAGLATASVTDVTDDILKFPTIPQIPKIDLHESLPQNIVQIFQQDNIPVMILLDLMCSSAKSWDVCNHLLDTIKSHQPPKPQSKADDSAKSLEPKNTVPVPRQRVNKIRTFSDIVEQIQCLLHLGAEDQISSKEQTTLARSYQKSVQYFLNIATHSLSAEKSKQYEVLNQSLSKYISKVEEAFQQSKVKGQPSPSRSEFRQRIGSTGSQSSVSGSKSDRPLVHHCMKQLIHALEKEVPAGGVISQIARSSGSRKNPNRNYLLSLYEHCKELAYLVAESESHSRETMVIPNNYFEVLEEGPLRILGRMMFKKKMAPAKLEKVAAKLSLNLTHIIVYSCCMKIPSKRLPLLQITTVHEGLEPKFSSGKIIYNVSKVSETSIMGNPEEFVRNLLMRLVSLMKEIARSCNAQGLFDTTCASLLTKHTDFYDIIKQTSVLQSADLLKLGKNEKLCFYGNLLTLMTIHCHVNHLWLMENQQPRESRSLKKDRLKPYSEMSATEQITFLGTFSYKVGQLGDLSIFDLRYQINRCGLLAPSEWGKTLENRLHPLDESDPWCQLAPHVNPQLLFTVTSCSVSAPPLQVLDPEHVKEQLQSSMKFYLQTCVQIDKQNRQVKIPELLLWYRRDFISAQSVSNIAGETYGLLAFIESQLNGEKEANLKFVIKEAETSPKKDSEHGNESKLQVDLAVIPHCKDFMCVFDFDSMSYAQQAHSSSGEMESKPGDLTLSDSDTTYNLTPNTLEYIKSDCPLVATLVSLMCSDDMEENLIDDAFDEGHFNTSGSSFTSSLESSLQMSLNRSRTSSSMSMLDLKSYRYEKLSNEYPALKRHLLNYIVPLAATEDPDILKGDDPILKLLTSDIVERFKTNMLSLHESSEFRILLTGLLDEMFNLRKWKEVLQVIDCIPVTVFRNQTSLCSLHDFVVCCLIHKLCSVADDKGTLNKDKSEDVMILLHRILSADGQAHEILAVHHKLQIDHNIDLFRMCLSRRHLSASMKEAVEQKFKQIKVFHRITECAKNLQFKLSLQSSGFVSEEDKLAAKKRHLILDKFTDWQTVVEWTKKTPKEVLGLLIKSGDFETAKSWSMLEKLEDNIKLEIEENHVSSLLNMQPPNTTKAFMLLEELRMKDKETCLTMCRKFLQVFNKQQDVLFIASYMLNQVESDLGRQELDSVRLTHIGARMILCLPESMHIEYGHLVTTPRYILEQLLMNMKPELASKAFHVVKEEFSLIREPANKFTTEQFNTLVALYAKRALEFTVIQVLEDKERSFSVRSTSSDKLDLEARDSPQLRQSPQPRHDLQQLKRRSMDLQGSRLAISAPHTSNSPVTKVTGVTKETTFVMPLEPPPRDQWIPDSAASVCMVCKVERFSMFNRRHHCRRCGRVVCAGCSEKVTPIKGINARTCEDCYREIVKSSEGDRRVSAAEIYQQYRLSDSSMPPSPKPVVAGGMIAAIQEAVTSQTLSEVISHSHTTWKLQTDDNYNANLREDFYFEQAPSTSLCISILNLHGNGRECGRLILNMCDDLSKYLKPLAPGIPNPEVDYNLIMSMMKYLLFHAKMKFTKCGDNAGMGQCDKYQGLVDILALLVVDNYKDLPSIDELTKVDSVRRLRDKLIGDERLSLAMEVSTKCGLDPTGVWVAWGMTCLQSGDFTGAREKFSKCLKPVKDKNVCSPLPKVLNDIIDCLESMPGTGAMEIQVLLANPGSLKNLINTPTSFVFECNTVIKTKCTFSIDVIPDKCGQQKQVLSSHDFCFWQKCSIEVFIEGLLKPSFEAGELGRLTNQMLLIDPSLERWNPFLTASCRYFVKHKLHHVLYEFQLFMKPMELRNCYEHYGAEGCCQMQGGCGSEWSQTLWLVKSPEEVSRYIKTIALQIEITKFFQACLTSSAGESASAAMSSVGSSKVPTLFGSQQVRNDLAIMILMCGDNIETSFTYAVRIIKEYKLGAVGIYTHVAREMAKGHQYDNMRSLLKCVEKTELATDDVMDEILGACLLVVADSPSEAKEAENIIKMLRKDANKINAYILCGKLRSAYLIAVKENRVDDVRRILRAAKSIGQTAVINICNKWLEQSQK
ncbi:zinc finger FYVE domain-containing protein 26-like [Mercenaria mercenaria]|uniref:zinc finger FYVE domain-containing protein 26-like n=1 Tax=Mercenaria mercenaria TaxID=6596 RepID=UPI00234E7EFF|nr:zinc finger FYVE domain-containing protein 26-like [Mercenaria mercenaria]